MAVSGDELRDAARLARESVVVANAVTLARWIGTGRRPVTAAQVLRKADVPAAGAALGVGVPPRPRPMADLRVLPPPWRAPVGPGRPPAAVRRGDRRPGKAEEHPAGPLAGRASA